jgi:UDP-perosamine 4-acetyltransferase
MIMPEHERKKLILVGAGGHAAVVEAAIAGSDEWEIAAIIDDSIAQGTKLVYGTVTGNRSLLPDFLQQGIAFAHVAIGDNAARERITRDISELGFQPVAIQHRTAVIEAGAETGYGSFLAAGSITGARAVIGAGCIINTAATIDHDCIIGDFSHVCPGVNLAGEVRVGKGTMIGIGATVIQQVTIGEGCMIGAGAVIIKDIPPGTKVVGNPGKAIEDG